MKIPFGTLTITEKSKKLICEALDSRRVSSGKYVREFEEKFAKLIGAKEAVAVSSGTDADALALAVLYDLGAQRGDQIIVPALSFVATGNAVLQAGFKPIFVDICRNTLNINPDKIEKAITEKTRAIMPVHLMGKPADMDRINTIAKAHNLYVIEDAAEAHGATYKGKNIGTLGDMAAFSLYVAHIISTVEGGIVTTDNPRFAEILRSLRSHGRACKCPQCVLNISSGFCEKRFQHGADRRFVTERIGFSSKMNEIEAAIGLGALDVFPEILKKRQENFVRLMAGFKRFHPFLQTIEVTPYEEIGPHAFPMIVGEQAKFTRNELVAYLEQNGIDTRHLFQSMPTQCPGFKFLGYKIGNFPNAEYVGNNGIHIGVHQDLNREHTEYFTILLEDFIAKYS